MRYGAKHAMWAPFKGNEPDNAMPTYGDVKSLGGINESNDTINFAEASAYADNAEKIHLKEFSNGTIDSRHLAVPFDLASEILGTAADELEGRSYGGDDDPPFGGYGFYSCYIDGNKKRTYGVIFYPKVQGSVASSNYKTKEDSITLEYDQLTFNILLPNCGVYKVEKRFDTEEEADNYLLGLFAGISEIPGIEGSGKGVGEKAIVPVSAETALGGDFGNAGQFFDTPPTIKWDGIKASVNGALKKVTGYSAFSGNKDEQDGHFYAIILNPEYEGMEVTCITPSREKTEVDCTWVIRMDNLMQSTKKVTFKVQGVTVAEFDFSGLTLNGDD